MTAPNSYGLEPLKATQLSARPSAMQAPFFSLNSPSARPTGSLLVAPTPGGPSSLSSSPPPTPAFVSQQPLGAQQAYLGHPQQASTLVDPSAASRAASYPSVRPQQPPSAGSSMFQPQGFGSVPSSSSLGEMGAQRGVEQQGGHGLSGQQQQQQPPQQLQQQDDTQVMTKLQQLMNQMGNFMKSVDARLTTLEKMTQQLISNQTEQAKTVDLRFQEIASLIQQKFSVLQIPSHQQPRPPTR